MTRPTKDDKDPDAVVVEHDLGAPPDKVWRALTERELVSRWLWPADRDLEDAGQVTLDADGEPIEGEVVEMDPPRRLKMRWREAIDERHHVVSEVTFTLLPTFRGGTRLRVVHDRFRHEAARMAA